MEPAETLLIACMLLFQEATGAAVHAAGRAVPALVEMLRGRLPDASGRALEQAMRDVIRVVGGKDAPEDLAAARERLDDALPMLRAMARESRTLFSSAASPSSSSPSSAS